jgi:hypothetical protein
MGSLSDCGAVVLPGGTLNGVDHAEELSGEDRYAYDNKEKSPASHEKTSLDTAWRIAEIECLFD